MARDMKELEQLYADIRNDEVCYYRGNEIRRSHDKHKSFMYSVNNARLFELFSAALDYIDSLEDRSIRL